MVPDPEQKPSTKLLGFLSIPAWIYPLWVGFWKLIEIAEHITFIREYFPWLMNWAVEHAPGNIDWAAVGLTLWWIGGLIFIAPSIAKRWGSKWAFASIMVPVFVAALIVGIYRGNADLKRENDAYHKRMSGTR